jgi:hypothetical protein
MLLRSFQPSSKGMSPSKAAGQQKGRQDSGRQLGHGESLLSPNRNKMDANVIIDEVVMNRIFNLVCSKDVHHISVNVSFFIYLFFIHINHTLSLVEDVIAHLMRFFKKTIIIIILLYN